MPKLTKRFVEATQTDGGDLFFWDDLLPGFGLRVRASGRRAFIVQYRTREGRHRRRTIGTFPTMTVDEARSEAREWLSDARKGRDRAEMVDRTRMAETLSELCDGFTIRYAKLHLKPTTADDYQRLIDIYIRPALGVRKAASVTQDDVAALHASMQKTPYQANRMLAVLSKIMNFAERDLATARPGWVNPCRGVKRYRETQRRRYMTAAELALIGEALVVAEAEGLAMPEAITAIRLLIFTGCRRGEILNLRWDEVDLDGRRLRLRDSKTGAKDVHLNPPALQLLTGTRRVRGNPHVIAGRRDGKPMREIKFAWDRVKRRAAGMALAALCETEGIGGYEETLLGTMLATDLPAADIAQLRWTAFDLDARTVATGRAYRSPLPPDVTSGLAALPRTGRGPFAGLPGGSKRTDRIFTDLIGRTGVMDLRLHDLRHSFAAIGAGAGLSLHMIGGLLGHSQAATTQRYAHLAADPLQDAADLIGRRLADAMGGTGEPATVIDIGRRKGA